MRWLAALLVFSGPLSAETISVQTGEHADFSRVVLAPARATDWSLTPTEQGYRLQFVRKDITFDTRRAFDLIPRDRIERIVAAQDAGALDFSLKEGISARSFETGDGVVVIDFSAAPREKQNARDEETVDSQSPEEPITRSPLTSLSAAEEISTQFFWRGIAPQLAAQKRATQPAVQPVAQPVAPGSTPSHETAQTSDASLPSNRVSEAEQHLIRELSRAAAQGLVRVDSQPKPEVASHEPANPESSVAHGGSAKDSASAEDTATQMAQLDPLAYQMTTAIDREMPHDAVSRSYTATGKTCLKDSDFDFAKWASDTPAGEQISDARRALVGEFDRADPQAVVALAKLYLALSFGAEAETVLNAFGQAVPERETLIYLARVMDDRAVDPESPLLAMLDCDSAVALWALLGSQGADPNREMNLAAIQRAFGALPHALRLAVADRLIERLISNGAAGAAKIVRRIAARVEPEAASPQISDARLDLAHGATQRAETELKAIVADDGADAVEALLLLVDTQFENGILTDAKTVENVAALAFEHRFAPDGGRLARAHVLAATAAGQFDRAVAALRRWPEDDHASRDRVAAQVYGAVTRNAEAVEFLRLSLDHPDLWQSARGDDTLWLTAAERFLSLGFPAQVPAMLGPDYPVSNRASLVLAQAYVGLGDGAKALSALSGVSDEKTGEIRAQALSLLVQPVASAEAYVTSGDTQAASREAWKAGAWGMASEFGTDAQKEAISSLSLIPSSSTGGADLAETPPAGPLARSQGLIDESARMRAALQALIKSSS